MYFAMGGFSYYFIFNHDMKKHPRYLPNQVWKEIKFSLQAFPWLVGMTVPWFVYEVGRDDACFSRSPSFAEISWSPGPRRRDVLRQNQRLRMGVRHRQRPLVPTLHRRRYLLGEASSFTFRHGRSL